MPYFLDTLGDLTDLRSQHELESGFTQLVLRIARADLVTLWRVETGSDKPALKQQAFAARKNLLPGPPPRLLPNDMTQLAAHKQLCIPGTTHLCYLFSISQGVATTALIEIRVGDAFSDDLMQILRLLMRVFGNHTDMLNNGQRDDLTGLRNRRGFGQDFSHLTEAGEERDVVAVLDIDHFKRVNDQFGHLHGDEVLINMARLMRSAFRRSDQIYRIGGEEFVVILHKTSLQGADCALTHCRSTVENTNFPRIGRMTISIGFSGVQPQDSVSAVFGRADAALYMAKSSGRNRVYCHEWLVEEGHLDMPRSKSNSWGLF